MEFINTTGCVDKLHLASEKWVRLAGDLQLDQRVFLAIFPLDGVAGRSTGLGQERKIAGEIFENNVPVIGRMDILFHGVFLKWTAKVMLIRSIYKPVEL